MMPMEGIILSCVGGNYEVKLSNQRTRLLKARGLFRKQGITPLMGDRVAVEEDFIARILPRKNETYRPAAANIDLLLVVFALEAPSPHFKLLDLFLIEASRREIPVQILFNKLDLLSQAADENYLTEGIRAYKSAGYPVALFSARQPEEEEMAALKALLQGRTTVLAGPSGVGKSTLINLLTGTCQEVGELSRKIARGKNTTRHARLLEVEGGGYIADTPGFSTFYHTPLEKEELSLYYPEFEPYQGSCHFQPCAHRMEPGCGVKAAVAEGKISAIRYENYGKIYTELSQRP